MFGVNRFINGICLNDKEWLLHDDGSLMKFDTESQAREFLGIAPDEDAYEEYGIFIELLEVVN